VTFWLADVLFGLRVSPEEEEAGLDASEHGIAAYPEFTGGSGGSPDSQPVSADGGIPGGESDD
jgi:Amt family ammonium transporter